VFHIPHLDPAFRGSRAVGQIDPLADNAFQPKFADVLNGADGGTVTQASWDAVTITWDNGHVAVVHYGDMREGMRTPQANGNGTL